ncbi:MAG: hypothetical protein JNM96_03355, partial [Bacteroidia bacterium]|nr:hypothetical protein [Bacteroidia bacterium]
TLKINVKGGVPPYDINWNQGEFNGTGPFTFIFKDSLTHSVKVTDSKSNSKEFKYYLKNTYDSLTYDYRNKITAQYVGIYNSSYMSYVGSTWTLVINPPESRTISVSKENLFNKILVDNNTYYCNRYYNFGTFPIYSSKINGRFIKDSIYFGGQPANGPNWYNFKGKLIP